MKTRFKTLEWIRAVRDEHAAEEENMTNAERLRRLKDQTKDLVDSFLRNHPGARATPPVAAHLVREKSPGYGPRKRRFIPTKKGSVDADRH